jgi:hypothetical protein
MERRDSAVLDRRPANPLRPARQPRSPEASPTTDTARRRAQLPTGVRPRFVSAPGRQATARRGPARAARKSPLIDRLSSETLVLIVVCLALATIILVLSALVGALDIVAFGAVLGVWALCGTTWLLLGRPGTDWKAPGLDRIAEVTRRRR